jgi:hypothetical protein
MTRTLDTINCPGWGDLTRLSDQAVENAFEICHARIKFDAMCAKAMPFIEAENNFRWENGGKERFRAMIKREFGRDSVV